MATVTLRNIRKRYGDFEACEDAEQRESDAEFHDDAEEVL